MRAVLRRMHQAWDSWHAVHRPQHGILQLPAQLARLAIRLAILLLEAVLALTTATAGAPPQQQLAGTLCQDAQGSISQTAPCKLATTFEQRKRSQSEQNAPTNSPMPSARGQPEPTSASFQAEESPPTRRALDTTVQLLTEMLALATSALRSDLYGLEGLELDAELLPPVPSNVHTHGSRPARVPDVAEDLTTNKRRRALPTAGLPPKSPTRPPCQPDSASSSSSSKGNGSFQGVDASAKEGPHRHLHASAFATAVAEAAAAVGAASAAAAAATSLQAAAVSMTHCGSGADCCKYACASSSRCEPDARSARSPTGVSGFPGSSSCGSSGRSSELLLAFGPSQQLLLHLGGDGASAGSRPPGSPLSSRNSHHAAATAAAGAATPAAGAAAAAPGHNACFATQPSARTSAASRQPSQQQHLPSRSRLASAAPAPLALPLPLRLPAVTMVSSPRRAAEGGVEDAWGRHASCSHAPPQHPLQQAGGGELPMVTGLIGYVVEEALFGQ